MKKLILWIVSLFSRAYNKPNRYNLDVQVENISEASFKNAMFNEINSFRKKNKLPVYSYHLNLGKVAVQHSKDMVYRDKPGHEYFPERERMFPELILSEVIGYNFKSAEGFLNAFLNSPRHKKIFFEPAYNHIGIGSETNKEGKRFLTIIFAKDRQ